MRRIKFVQCSDIHMDAPFTSLGHGGGKSAERRMDLKDAFRKVIDAVVAEEADLLLICGDLYEHRYVKKSTITFINSEFERIPHADIIILPGNHDPYTPDSFYRNFLWNGNVHILCREKPYVSFDDRGVCVYGAGFDGAGAVLPWITGSDGLRPFDGLRPDFINILALHGTLDMNFNGASYNPVSGDEEAFLRMDYVGLGHFHNRMEGRGEKGNIYNPGSPEPLGFDEVGEHGFFTGEIVKRDSSSAEVHVRFITANNKYYEDIELDMDGCGADEQVIRRIQEALEKRDAPRGIFSVRLKGYVEPGFRVNAAQVQAFFDEKAFFIRVKDETRPAFDIDRILGEPGLRGLFARKIHAMLEQTDDGRRKEMLFKALYYGLQALEEGEIDINAY